MGEQSLARRCATGGCRLAAAALLSLVAIATLTTTPACVDKRCEDSLEFYCDGDPARSGRFVDDLETTWESNPVDREWLSFPHVRTYIFSVRDFGSRVPTMFFAYVSAVSTPRDPNNFTLAAGDLAIFSSIDSAGDAYWESRCQAFRPPTCAPPPRVVRVTNNTCADMFLRVVLVFAPPLADAGTPVHGDGCLPDAATSPVDSSAVE